MYDFGVGVTHLRPFANSDSQKRGYLLAPLASVWRRYLPPLAIPNRGVTGVTAVTRAVLDEYFAWVGVDDDGHPVTPVTGVTGVSGGPDKEKAPDLPNSDARDLAKYLDPRRTAELALWWRSRIRQLRGELSPAMAKAKVKEALREVLAEEVQADALDAEIARIARAAGKASQKSRKPVGESKKPKRGRK
jgi:hypothetical protein